MLPVLLLGLPRAAGREEEEWPRWAQGHGGPAPLLSSLGEGAWAFLTLGGRRETLGWAPAASAWRVRGAGWDGGRSPGPGQPALLLPSGVLELSAVSSKSRA